MLIASKDLKMLMGCSPIEGKRSSSSHKGYSNNKQEKLSKKRTCQSNSGKSIPKLGMGNQLLEPLLQTPIFSLGSSLNILPHMQNHNSANHKSGQFQQHNLHMPYGSAKSQTFANSVCFTFGTGKSNEGPYLLTCKF